MSDWRNFGQPLLSTVEPNLAFLVTSNMFKSNRRLSSIVIRWGYIGLNGGLLKSTHVVIQQTFQNFDTVNMTAATLSLFMTINH